MGKKTNIAAIILAAGKGKRMDSKKVNKVVLPLAGKPMILYIVQVLKNLDINPIVAVVGFAKKSVIQVLGSQVMYAEQRKRLGTAHAVGCGLKKLSDNIENVIILQGDDSAFNNKEIIANLIKAHISSNSVLTFLTLELDNPFGLGRVIRDSDKKVIGIVEEKDATMEQRKIKEINPACYIFKTSFLKKYLKKIKKSKITGEYYLTNLIDIAISNKEKIETIKNDSLRYKGVNTKEELKEAEKYLLMQSN